MSAPKRQNMPPAPTEVDEIWFQFRLSIWPRELRSWLKRQERFDRNAYWKEFQRSERAQSSLRKARVPSQPRRTA